MPTTEDLIRTLTQDHRPRPWWKRRGVLLALWVALTAAYFLGAMAFASKLDPQGSAWALSVNVVASFLAARALGRELNSDDRSFFWTKAQGAVALLLLAVAFASDDLLAHTVSHQRGASVTEGDVSCFTHTVLIGLVPLDLSLWGMRHFFVPHRRWASGLLALHVGVLCVLWTEMNCPEREFWHLVLGHQTAIVGLALLALSFASFPRRRVPSAS